MCDPGDLRRRARRDVAQSLVERCALLPESERALVLAVYRDGVTVKDLAAAAGCVVRSAATNSARDPGPRSPEARERSADAAARALRRRLRAITSRLLDPKFEFVSAYLKPGDQDERRRLGLPCWPPLRRRVADLCVIRGLSLREVALELSVSFHRVRREMLSIHALFEARLGR